MMPKTMAPYHVSGVAEMVIHWESKTSTKMARTGYVLVRIHDSTQTHKLTRLFLEAFSISFNCL